MTYEAPRYTFTSFFNFLIMSLDKSWIFKYIEARSIRNLAHGTLFCILNCTSRQFMSLRRYTADEWCSIGNGIFWFIPFFNIIAESHVFFHSLSTVLLNDVGARVSALITSFAGIWLIRNNWLFISLFYVYLTHIDILFLVVHLNQMISRISFDWNWATFLIVLIIKVAEAIILVCLKNTI